MSVIDTYLNTVAAPERSELQKIRNTVLQVVPEAKEVITYGMPGFKYQGKYLISFAAFKDHLSIFPGSEAVAEFESRLGEYKLSKGTIQFSLEKPLPDKLLRGIIESCKQAIDHKLNAKNK